MHTKGLKNKTPNRNSEKVGIPEKISFMKSASNSSSFAENPFQEMPPGWKNLKLAHQRRPSTTRALAYDQAPRTPPRIHIDPAIRQFNDSLIGIIEDTQDEEFVKGICRRLIMSSPFWSVEKLKEIDYISASVLVNSLQAANLIGENFCTETEAHLGFY